MNRDRINDVVSHLDYLISELVHLKSKLTIEEGVHFNVINDEEMLGIEIWDSDQSEPRSLCYIPKEEKDISKEDIEKQCCLALNALGFREHRKQIYWNSEIKWEELPENFRKLDEVYKIEKRNLSSEMKFEAKRRIYDLYRVSERKEA